MCGSVFEIFPSHPYPSIASDSLREPILMDHSVDSLRRLMSWKSQGWVPEGNAMQFYCLTQAFKETSSCASSLHALHSSAHVAIFRMKKPCLCNYRFLLWKFNGTIKAKRRIALRMNAHRMTNQYAVSYEKINGESCVGNGPAPAEQSRRGVDLLL